MATSSLVIVGIGALAAGLALGWWARVALSREERPDEETRQPEASARTGGEVLAEPDDPRARRRALADEVDSVRKVYREIGYSPIVEEELAKIRRELRQRIVVEIPDHGAFREALQEARSKMDRLAETSGIAGAGAPASVRHAARLLEDVWERRDRPAAVLDRLEQDPVRDQLPFIERVPIEQSGDIRWRTPARVSVLRKRPADARTYRQLLDRLSSTVDQSELPRPEAAVQDVRTALGRLREDLSVDDAYVPTLLRRLEDALDEWLHESPSAEMKARKNDLDAFLTKLLTLRAGGSSLLEHSQNGLPRSWRPDVSDEFQQEAAQLARTYSETEWIRAPWLTDAVLTNLMAAEVLRVRQDAEVPEAFVRHLEIVQREVRSRGYDPVENIRRLRLYESEGYFVHSLAFSLLRERTETRDASSVSA